MFNIKKISLIKTLLKLSFFRMLIIFNESLEDALFINFEFFNVEKN